MTPEKTLPDITKFNGCLGSAEIELGTRAIDILNLLPRYEGQENLLLASETLRQNGSVLIISNHPDTLQTIIIGHTIDLLRRFGEHVKNAPTGAIITDKFSNGEADWYGPLIPHIVRRKGVEPLEVAQVYNSENSDQRISQNLASIRKAYRILKNHGILAYFPEGTRSERMKIRERGLSSFAEKADTIIIQTTEKQAFGYSVTYQSIQGKNLLSEFRQKYGNNGNTIYEELVMSLMASKLRNRENRGYYRNRLDLARYIMSGKNRLQEISDNYLSLFFPEPELDPQKPNKDNAMLYQELTPEIQRNIMNELINTLSKV